VKSPLVYKRDMVWPRGQVVYFIQAESGGLVKIGIASNLKSRFQGIQNMCPVKLRVLGWMEGYVELERQLHQRYSALRMHGEWFRWEEPLISDCPDIEGNVSAKTIHQIRREGRVPYPTVKVYGKVLEWHSRRVDVLLDGDPGDVRWRMRDSFQDAGLLDEHGRFTPIAQNCVEFHVSALRQLVSRQRLPKRYVDAGGSLRPFFERMQKAIFDSDRRAIDMAFPPPEVRL